MEEYNGSAVVAMAGKNCVGIATDTRLGVNRYHTISSNFQKVFKQNDRCFVGFVGLATDVQTLNKELAFRSKLFCLRDDIEAMPPSLISSMVSSMLYQKRFSPYFASPVVAGLDPKTSEPFLSAFDFIGAACHATDFVASGSAAEQLMGVCESLWKPDMNEDELTETLGQCLLSAIDRDCFSGWGGIIHIITPDKILTRRLKARMD